MKKHFSTSVFSILIVSLIIQLGNTVYAKDSLTILSVKEYELDKIIDSFVFTEVNCEYYSKDLHFFISLSSYNSSLQIGSFDSIVETQSLGCLSYHGHLVVIYGSSLDTSLFTTTLSARKVKFLKPVSEFDPSFECYINLGQDKQYSYRWYHYHDSVFTLIGRHSYCR